MGTRFYAATEALGHWRAKEYIVAAKGEDTRRTRVFDVVRGHEWPEPYTGRALHNHFLERWEGREDALVAELDTESRAFHQAVSEGDFGTAMVWAGEAVDLIVEVKGAAELVRNIGMEAESNLRHVNRFLRPS
jgi:nitronate monooxygenase